MLNLAKGFGSVVPEQSTAVSFMRVKVALEPNDLLEDIAKAYSKEISRISRFEIKKVELDEETVLKFFKTMLFLHISNCNGDFHRDYRVIKNNAVIPALLTNIMLQIGETIDHDFGLKFQPIYEIDSIDMLSVSQLQDIFDEFLLIERLGLKLTTAGFPNPKECGTLGFMGCQLVSNGDVLSYRHDSPVFGFFKAMFNTNALEEALGLKALRIRYGSFETYKTLVRTFVNEVEVD